MQATRPQLSLPAKSAVSASKPARGPIVLELNQLKFVAGGSPKGGWEQTVEQTDPGQSPKGGW